MSVGGNWGNVFSVKMPPFLGGISALHPAVKILTARGN